MAIFLVGVALALIAVPSTPLLSFVPDFLLQMILGAAIGLAIGTEARAMSNLGTVWGPSGKLIVRTPELNLIRDPRWGRNVEVTPNPNSNPNPNPNPNPKP